MTKNLKEGTPVVEAVLTPETVGVVEGVGEIGERERNWTQWTQHLILMYLGKILFSFFKFNVFAWFWKLALF